MAKKAKFAFGKSNSIEAAKQANKIDSFDLLLLDGDTDPKVGWLDANGNAVIVPNKTDLSGVEAELATKANAEEVMTKKYEIADVPEGTLVKMSDSEIRIMCPVDAVFTKQSVGAGGDANSYYMTLKTYVYNDNVVGYREHLGDQVDAEILTDLKTDQYGRRYQPTWLALAKYDETTGTWNYYGKSSTSEKFTGWDYQIDFYDAKGKMIASDSIRINLSNEQCHSSIEPYYVGAISKEIDAKIEEKITEINTGYEIVEF